MLKKVLHEENIDIWKEKNYIPIIEKLLFNISYIIILDKNKTGK